MSSSVGRMLKKMMLGIPKAQPLTGAGLRRITGVVRVCEAEAAVPSSTVGIAHGEVVDYGVESFDTAPDDESRSRSLSGDDHVGDESSQPTSDPPSAGKGMDDEGSNREKKSEGPARKEKGGASYVWEKGEILGSAF